MTPAEQALWESVGALFSDDPVEYAAWVKRQHNPGDPFPAAVSEQELGAPDL